MVGLEEIDQAAQRLRPVLRPTPAVFSGPLTTLLGRTIYVKPEHFQRTGSFKIRGAFNRIASLAATGGAVEIVAASAGNHAQGVALAASLSGLHSTIFMPAGASLPKIDATRGYGAEVRFEAGPVDNALARPARTPPIEEPITCRRSTTRWS